MESNCFDLYILSVRYFASTISDYGKKKKQTKIHWIQSMHCAVMIMIVWLSDLQLELPVQSVPITTKVVGSNPAHGRVYTIQHYVINFVSDVWQACGFLCPCTLVSSTNKTDCHNMTEILSKMALKHYKP